MPEEPQRRLILLDDRAILVRTPWARSLEFVSAAAAQRWLDAEGPMWTVLGVVMLGGVASRLLFPADVFLHVFGAWFALGMAGMGALQLRMWWVAPKARVLSWDEAAAWDPRPIPMRDVLAGAAGGLVLGGVALGLAVVLDWPKLWWRQTGTFLLALGAVVLFSGLSAYLGHAVAGVLRFRAAQARRR